MTPQKKPVQVWCISKTCTNIFLISLIKSLFWLRITPLSFLTTHSQDKLRLRALEQHQSLWKKITCVHRWPRPYHLPQLPPPPLPPPPSPWHCSDDGLQLGLVPHVHAVVAHQLVRAGKLLLTVGPAAGEGLLTWREAGRARKKHRKSLL